MLEKRARGSVELPAARRKRIERALEDLRSWQDEPALIRFVGLLQNPWFEKQPTIDVVTSNDPCTTAGEIFEQEAARFAGLFAALRIAALEIEDRYDPEVHDSWFASFDWQAFSDEELQLVTRIVALVSAVLSTIDSAILAPASVLSQNILLRFTRIPPLRLNRIAVVLVAAGPLAGIFGQVIVGGIQWTAAGNSILNLF